jgi:hypothetical protein
MNKTSEVIVINFTSLLEDGFRTSLKKEAPLWKQRASNDCLPYEKKLCTIFAAADPFYMLASRFWSPTIAAKIHSVSKINCTWLSFGPTYG